MYFATGSKKIRLQLVQNTKVGLLCGDYCSQLGLRITRIYEVDSA